ncbi:MAG: hypothetical protein IKP26_03365 [Clostridia bacterium]|nr:hypothetical protein [Clostridia bacterium]
MKNANKYQIAALRTAIGRLLEVDPGKRDFAHAIEAKTMRLTVVSEQACIKVTALIYEMIEGYNEAIENAIDVLNMIAGYSAYEAQLEVARKAILSAYGK